MAMGILISIFFRNVPMVFYRFIQSLVTGDEKLNLSYFSRYQTRRKAKTTLVSQHFGQESTQILTDAGHESTKSKESGGQGLNEDSTVPFEDPSS